MIGAVIKCLQNLESLRFLARGFSYAPFFEERTMKNEGVGEEMKKVISFVLALSIVFALCGCGGQKQPEKPDTVKNVERLIDAIGDVSLDKEKYITDAESAYESLYEADKDLVDNYNTLIKARAEYDSLIEAIDADIKAEIADALELMDDENTVMDAVSRLEELRGRAITYYQSALIQGAIDMINTQYYEGTTFKRFEIIAPQLIDGLEIKQTEYNDGVYYYSFNKNGIAVEEAYNTYLRERYTGKTVSDEKGYVTAHIYTDSKGNTLSILVHSFSSGDASKYISIKIN